ncbi:MAG: peroxide stress protein YaaA, partial [Alloprevotella sp.]|nr:peroxide stress protein YaaA [Alloprevotella sp.]
VWAKACRGAMVRFILEHRLSDPSALTAFSYEGFRYHADASDARHLCFVRED